MGNVAKSVGPPGPLARHRRTEQMVFLTEIEKFHLVINAKFSNDSSPNCLSRELSYPLNIVIEMHEIFDPKKQKISLLSSWYCNVLVYQSLNVLFPIQKWPLSELWQPATYIPFSGRVSPLTNHSALFNVNQKDYIKPEYESENQNSTLWIM